MSDYNAYVKSCIRCSGSGMIIGFNGDPQDCYDCLGDGVITVTFETLNEDLDAVLHDMGIPYPPMSKQMLRTIYLKLRRMHDNE